MAATACRAHVLVGARELAERCGGGAAPQAEPRGGSRVEGDLGPGLGVWELCLRDRRALGRLRAGARIRREGGRRAGLE